MTLHLTAVSWVGILVCTHAFAIGSVEGTVRFIGPLPKVETLQRQIDPVCAKTEAKDEAILVRPENRALQNVVIRLKGLTSSAPVPPEPVVIDQRGCLYHPRIVVAREGQGLRITNSDLTLHNVHSYAGTNRTLFNQAQPPKAPPLMKHATGEDVIALKCDVHPWMKGYVAVATNPYFAVTSADGKFKIGGIPNGRYTVEAWHEMLGGLTAEIVIKEGKSSPLTFTFGSQK